jgi:hypothetical protein
MLMTPSQRRTALVAHVVCSVGWLGAVAAFLVLSITALRDDSRSVVVACYLAMDVVGRYVIVPMSVLTLASGLLQSLGTVWGLFRHYWVVAKLGLTVLATIGLLVHQYTLVAAAAARASSVAVPDAELDRFGWMLARDASLAILVLLAAAVLSIFKPWGPIREDSRVLRWAGWALAAAVAIFLVVHLLSGGAAHHREG